MPCRYHSGYEISLWETTLHCDVVSHWLGSYHEWSLHLHSAFVYFLGYECFSFLKEKGKCGIPGISNHFYGRWHQDSMITGVFCVKSFKTVGQLKLMLWRNGIFDIWVQNEFRILRNSLIILCRTNFSHWSSRRRDQGEPACRCGQRSRQRMRTRPFLLVPYHSEWHGRPQRCGWTRYF